MLVVISDLHFEEEKSNYVGPDDHPNKVRFSRNLPGFVFERFIDQLAGEAVKNGAKKLDLVFAGDIFDLHRTGLWFTDNPNNVRPYVNNKEVSPEEETMLVKVLNEITTAKGVAQSLAAFQKLGQGQEFPVEVEIHYFPGNHDRLANATPKVRKLVREALGMSPSEDPFPNYLELPQYHALIRHGQEYDRYNFSVDNTHVEPIPLHIPVEAYDEAPFGDFVTVDIASHSPYLFRQEHKDENILTDSTLRDVYLRLLEFDDLRPQSAIFNYLIHMPDKNFDPVKVWKIIEPVIYRLLEEIHDQPFLKKWLKKMDKNWQLDVIDVIQTTMALRPWRLPVGIPLGLAQFISNTAVGHVKERPGAQSYAAREEAIKTADYHFVVGGHTHHPATELIASDERGERYYIDTGTWRNRVPATGDYKAFGHLKTLTYAVIYSSDEDLGPLTADQKFASLDFWSGVTQRWPNPPV